MIQKKYLFYSMFGVTFFIAHAGGSSWFRQPLKKVAKEVPAKNIPTQQTFASGYKTVLKPSVYSAKSVGEKAVSGLEKKPSLYDRLKKLLQKKQDPKTQVAEKEPAYNPQYDPRLEESVESGYKKLYPDVSDVKRELTFEDPASEWLKTHEGPVPGEYIEEVYGKAQKPVVGIPIPQGTPQGVVTGKPIYGRLEPLTPGAKNLSQEQLAKIETEARRRYAEWIKAGKTK